MGSSDEWVWSWCELIIIVHPLLYYLLEQPLNKKSLILPDGLSPLLLVVVNKSKCAFIFFLTTMLPKKFENPFRCFALPLNSKKREERENMEETTINSCFRTAVLQGIVCGALIGLHRFRNPSGKWFLLLSRNTTASNRRRAREFQSFHFFIIQLCD